MSARILIVEDERLVAEDIRVNVESFGYQVCGVVGSGELAIERCSQFTPDLVLMDICLKGELNGIEAAQKICQQNDIAIIFLTAFSDAQLLQQAQSVLPYGYLLKPFNEQQLQAAIQIALYKHSAEKQIREHQQRLNTVLGQLDTLAGEPRTSQPLLLENGQRRPTTRLAKPSKRNSKRKQQFDGLLHTLAHDLRTPLLASRLTLRSLLRGAFGPVDQALQEVLSESESSNEELIKMVEALLEIARYETDSRVLLQEPLVWDRLLQLAIERLQATFTSQLNIRYQIESLPGPVLGDPYQITCLLQSLLDNAVRASGSSDHVDLKIEFERPDRVKVSISDQGQGIAASVQKQLFKKFLSNRGRSWGAGLSLYLCNLIVKAHGGTIDFSSTSSLGSTFWFTLPLNVASGNK